MAAKRPDAPERQHGPTGQQHQHRLGAPAQLKAQGLRGMSRAQCRSMNIVILDDYQDAVRKLQCASRLEPYSAKVFTNTV